MRALLVTLYHSRLFYPFVLVVITIWVGTVGYHLLEGWALIDALYMTVITITTVGYGEIHPLSVQGRIFTMLLLISSIGLTGYAVSAFTAFVVEGEFHRLLEGRRMDKKIASLKDHIILCGGGHTGEHIAAEFYKTHTPFVLIEHGDVALQHVLRLGDIPYIQADATQDEVLLLAGIKHAKGLVAALGEDKDNVFIVLSARSLNPTLRIVARLSEEKNVEKLRKAGADEIVSANAIGGLRMASVMLRPSVVTFLDEMLRVKDQTLRVEEVTISSNPLLLNRTLAAADIGRRMGVLVLAIKSPDGSYRFNPGAQLILRKGDILIVIGTPEQIKALRQSAPTP